MSIDLCPKEKQLHDIRADMLAIDPDDRFATPAEVASTLSRFTSGSNLGALLAPEKPPAISHLNPTGKETRFSALPIILTIFALLAIAAFGVIFNLKTKYGTVEIQTNDKNVEVSVKQAGEEIEIINAESGWRIRLKEGKYEVDLKGGKDKFKLDQQSITISRDDKITVRVTLKKNLAEKAGLADQNLRQTHAKRRSYMLEFSGRQTHVVIPKLRYDGSHPITFEATVMSLYRGSIIADFNGSGLGLDVADGYCSFHVNDGRTADNGYVRVKSSTSVGRGKPVHIAGVLDGSKLSLFVDGKLQGSETIGKFNKSKFPFMIGADPGGQGEPTQFRNGFIDEVRVSKTARYDKDFAPPSKLESDKHTLVLYGFDEGEGDVANDASGNGLHGKIHNAKWVAAKEATGPVEAQTIQRLRQIGVKITEKNGVVTDFAFGNSPKITDADLKALESLSSLETLTLIGCTNVTDAGLKHLIDNRKITVLYLNNTKITDAGLTFLEQMKDMYWMDLESTGLTDVGLARLGHMSKMELLSLGRTGVTDAGLPRLQRFPKLRLLGLNNTAVTDAGMVHLAELSSLKQLILSDTLVTAAGLVRLAKLKNLKELQLLNTPIPPAHIEELRKQLPKDCKIQHSFLGHRAGDFSSYGQGTALMKWASTLETGSKNVEIETDEDGRVKSVSMGGGMMTDEGLSHLKELRDVENLTLSYTYGCTAEGLKHVQQMTKVKFLRLWGNYNFSDGVSYLSGMTNVETLFLHKLRVTDENMKFIKGMKGCKLFQMTLNPTVTDAGIAHLAGLTELESVYLTCPQLTDECLKYFHDMSKLRSLLISSQRVTKAGLQKLSKTLPKLKDRKQRASRKTVRDEFGREASGWRSERNESLLENQRCEFESLLEAGL